MYKKIINEAIERKEFRQKKDEEFILKFLFIEIDKQGTGVISK